MDNQSPGNPNDYNRAERENISWWSSRRGRDSRSTGFMKKGRRITLIDMLLLVVMAGILIPWILSMDRSLESGPYKVYIDVQERSSDVLVKLEIALPDDAGIPADTVVGWNVYGIGSLLLHEDRDLPPNPGESRIFRFISTEGTPDRLEILAGEGNLVISPVE